MEILGFHVPGTRDKDKEIEQLQAALSQARQNAKVPEDGYPYQVRSADGAMVSFCTTLSQAATIAAPGTDEVWRRENGELRLVGPAELHQESQKRAVSQPEELLQAYAELQDLHREIDFERSQYEGLQERYNEVKAELHDVKTELGRWHSLAPYQVRQEGTRVVVASCPTLKEASDRACRWEEDLSIWMRTREGTYREMAPQEVTEMLTAQKLREVAALRHEAGMSQERLEAPQEALRQERESDPERQTQSRQPQRPRRREQPQAPPPHVLYRSPGPSRGMER